MNCLLRHPRECKFFSNFGRCKFAEQCALLHRSQNQTFDLEIRELRSAIMKTESKIKDIVSLQERIEKLEFILEASEEIDIKLSDRVSKLEARLNEQTQPKSIL